MCADVFTRAKRSEIMSRIKHRGNRSTEERFKYLLRTAHVSGWRRHSRLVGKPDFVFPRAKLAVFIDGCFWHGCRKCRSIPEKNRTFWSRKLRRNRARDIAVAQLLRAAGWSVMRVWEHDLKKPSETIERLKNFLARAGA
jgi:DNA mismatch endonuclease (patch repair protein)